MDRIHQIVKCIFDNIPYSDEVGEAQTRIEAALHTEYEKLCAEMAEDEAFEELLQRFHGLDEMARLAGYADGKAAEWRTRGDVIELPPLKKEFRYQRVRVCAVLILMLSALEQLWWIIYNVSTGQPLSALWNILSAAVGTGIAFTIMRRMRRIESAAVGASYDTDAYRFMRGERDRYTKRLLNSTALLTVAACIFVFAGIMSFLLEYKSAEFGNRIIRNAIVAELPLLLFIKNLLITGMLRRRLGLHDRRRILRQSAVIAAGSAVYWIFVLTLTALLERRLKIPLIILLIFAVVYIIALLAYNMTWRSRITYRNFVFNGRRVAAFAAAAVVAVGYVSMSRDTWYTQPYINSVSKLGDGETRIEYDDETGIYTLTSSKDEFRILHLTDIHIGGSLYSYRKDMMALRACYAEIEYTRPDFVIVTGDLCFPLGIMSLSLNNTAPVNQFAAFMRNIGIPWAFTYGNHDTESIASADIDEIDGVYRALSYKTSGTLLYPYIQPNITGRNNQLIELRRSDGTLNTALFLLDSNAYTGDGVNSYDYIHDDQVDWYADEAERLGVEAGHTVNSLVFFHIPLQEYRTAYELYESGSDEVEYYFGENGERMINKVCCSEYPSSLFDRMTELGSTTGTFCGHDHYNNMSLGYRGIRLTYGMSIDYLAMPGIEYDTAQRGAELITIYSDSSWDVRQIPLTQITEAENGVDTVGAAAQK